jgi:hypothetical protein
MWRIDISKLQISGVSHMVDFSAADGVKRKHALNLTKCHSMKTYMGVEE